MARGMKTDGGWGEDDVSCRRQAVDRSIRLSATENPMPLIRGRFEVAALS